MALEKQKLQDTLHSSPRHTHPIARFNMMHGVPEDEYERFIANQTSTQAIDAAWESVQADIPQPEIVTTPHGDIELRCCNWEDFRPNEPVTVRLLGFEATTQKIQLLTRIYD